MAIGGPFYAPFIVPHGDEKGREAREMGRREGQGKLHDGEFEFKDTGGLIMGA